MITFADDREAKGWWDVLCSVFARHDDLLDVTATAVDLADAAVLEYRKRRAQSEPSQYRPRPRAEWRECDGPALWWAPHEPFPLLRGEDEYLPDEYTMWTPLPPAPTEWPGSENYE